MGDFSDVKKTQLRPIEVKPFQGFNVQGAKASDVKIDLGGNQNFGKIGEQVEFTTKGNKTAANSQTSSPAPVKDSVLERAEAVSNGSDIKEAKGALDEVDNLDTEETETVKAKKEEENQAADLVNEKTGDTSEAQNRVKNSQESVKTAKDAVTTVKGEIKEQQGVIAEDRKAYTEAQAKTRLASGEVKIAKTSVAAAQTAVNAARAAVPYSAAALSAAEAKLAAAKKALQTAEQNLKKAQEQEQAAKTKLENDEKKLEQLETKLEKAEKTLEKEEKKAQELKTALQACIASLGQAKNLFAQKKQAVQETTGMTEAQKAQVRNKLWTLIRDLENEDAQGGFSPNALHTGNQYSASQTSANMFANPAANNTQTGETNKNSANMNIFLSRQNKA